jgi:hypothetical protein
MGVSGAKTSKETSQPLSVKHNPILKWEELDAQNTYELFEEEKDERTAAKEKADAVNEAQKALDDMAKE